MGRVLIVEDEIVLRTSMARGLAKLASVEVQEAGSVEAALELIDRAAPDFIVSDIDLPGRCGLELVGELKRRSLDTPLLFVSAYLKAYRPQIPPNANVEVLEKPVPLEELRTRVLAQLRAPRRARAPFGLTDYVQLACMGRHSVEILVAWPPRGQGRVLVAKGELWSARDAEGRGLPAFQRFAYRADASVECRSLDEHPGQRDIEQPWEMVLLEGARLADEAARAEAARRGQAAAEAGGRPPGSAAPEAPPAPPAPAAPAATFDDLWDVGVEALLKKDYGGALQAFVAARALRPDDPRVLANLKRLADMGYPGPPAPGPGR